MLLAKKIIKYLLHKNDTNGLITPYFVNDPGHFGWVHEYIGVSEDDEIIYLPDTVDILTNQQFVDYVVSLPLRTPPSDELKTTEEKTTIAVTWIRNRGLFNARITSSYTIIE